MAGSCAAGCRRMHTWGSGMGRPLLAACAAVLSGADLGIGSPCWLAVLPLPLLLISRTRAPALGLALGLLRGAVQEQPKPFILPDEFEGVVVALGTVRVQEGLVALRLRGIPVHRGDRARFFGQVHQPPPRLNPGGRDRRAQLLSRGIAVEGNAEVVEVLERGPWLWRAVDDLRSRFAERAARICSTPDRAALVTALAVGDRSGLSRESEAELAASGLVHLLASSGLHLAVVTLLLRAAGRHLWLRTPLASRLRAPAFGAALAAPFAVAEVLLLGAPWPAVRAGLGAGLALGGSVWARRTDGLTTLALAAAACAVADPAATHELALQLSVAGIAGLLVLARPLREILPLPLPAAGAPVWRRLLEHMVALGCSTAAAALCTAPLLAAAFHRISLVSVAANAIGLFPGLLAIPIASLAAPLDAVAPAAALPLLWAADHLAGLTLFAARAFASIPVSVASVPAPGIVVAVLWCAAGFLLAGYPSRLSSLPRRRVRVARGALAFAACALVSTTTTALEAHRGELRVTFLAVGQGDAAIVQLPAGGAILVDGGGDLHGLRDADPKGRIVLSALAELGIRRLDAVVLTHPHPDHAGGLFAVLDRVPVSELWTTGEPGPGGIGDALRARAALRGVRLAIPETGRFELREGVGIEVLHSGFRADHSANDNSMVLRF